MITGLNRFIAYLLLNTLAGSHVCTMRLRRFIYRLYGHKISTVFAECFLGVGNGKLKVGKNSFCNYRCFFDLSNDIKIGNNCSIAYNVTFVTSTHTIGDSERRGGGGQKCSNYYRRWRLDWC